MQPPPTSRQQPGPSLSRKIVPASLIGVAVLSAWVIASLVLALLGRADETITTLHLRGIRGVPAVVWAGSRDLVSWLRPGTDVGNHD